MIIQTTQPQEPAKPLQPFEPETLRIPAGPFTMGRQPAEGIPAWETPAHTVELPAYRLGRYPVTMRQYAAFLTQATSAERPSGWRTQGAPAGQEEYPVVGVSWLAARAYCAWLTQQTGRCYRLPTEAEWEKAARGPQGWPYPWGEAWQEGLCQCGATRSVPVTAYPQGVSAYGCSQMLGNVEEWTSTLWGSDPQACAFPYPYHVEDGREDLTAEQRLPVVYRVHRGGSYRDPGVALRCSARGYAPPSSKVRWRGFRVVLEA